MTENVIDVTSRYVKTYLKILSVLYLVGALLHVMDLLDLRLRFSQMPVMWKGWIIYLALFDSIAAAGLWKQKVWGVYCFFLVAISQLVAYSAFMRYFGEQYALIAFHLITLVAYFAVKKRASRA